MFFIKLFIIKFNYKMKSESYKYKINNTEILFLNNHKNTVNLLILIKIRH